METVMLEQYFVWQEPPFPRVPEKIRASRASGHGFP